MGWFRDKVGRYELSLQMAYGRNTLFGGSLKDTLMM